MKSASLQAIPVSIEQSSGNVEPLLHEIRHALALLLSCGTGSCIDLKTLPFAPGEEERILALLGNGEVRAELTLFGKSEIAETAFPGVWLVSHYDGNGEPQGRFVEITHVPAILCSQAADISAGLQRLTARLSIPSTEQTDVESRPATD
jgi:hydrogenase-1 operon protein HyaF